MNLLLNIIWLVFGGFILVIGYLLGAILLCITIIGIPFGIQCFKLADLALVPFGRRIEDDPRRGSSSALFNVLWLVLAGIWIALTHVMFAFMCAVTVIGIPFAVQHIKLAMLGLWPFGKRVVT